MRKLNCVMKYYKYIALFALLMFSLAGCTSDPYKIEKEGTPDEELLKYMPVSVASYYGDSEYYHEVQSIDVHALHNVETITLSGEVRENFKGKTHSDDQFNIELIVDQSKVIQKVSGSQLNDSKFAELILLKSPIEVGNKWIFVAADFLGVKYKVTGEIIEVDKISKSIVVKYSCKDGYYEQRTFESEKGVTDFIKKLAFKDSVSYTGYHIDDDNFSRNDEKISDSFSFESFVSIDIDENYLNLILGFNTNWANYVMTNDEEILKFVYSDSLAHEKISAMNTDTETFLEFIELKPYEIEIEPDLVKVSVYEKYRVDNKTEVVNKIRYEISNYDSVPLISNFHFIKD